MIQNVNYVFVFVYLIGVLSFCFKGSNLLSMLLSLEFMSLSLVGCLYVYMMMFGGEKYFLLYYLGFCVCEGALGLGLLISMVRFQGNDFFNSLVLLKC